MNLLKRFSRLTITLGAGALGVFSVAVNAQSTPGYDKYKSYVENSYRQVSQVATSAAPPPVLLSFEEMAAQAHDANYVLVRFNSAAASIDSLRGYGVRHAKALNFVPGLHRMRTPTGVAMQDLLEQLNADPDVAYAEPDYITQTTAVPNDPLINGANAWWLNQIDAYNGWDIATDASAIGPIAVFDNGVEPTHEDLADNMWVNAGEVAGNGIDDDGNGYIDDIHGVNVLNLAPNEDTNTHGTPVAGTMCGRGNNGLGYVGSAWTCQIMVINSLDDLDNTLAAVVEGFGYAIAMGSRISNHSWRVFMYSQSLADAVTGAEAAGHLVVAAAGNEASDIDARGVNYPARLPNDNVITVAASFKNDRRIYYSSYGPTSVDLAAPTHFGTTYVENTYIGFSGTSQSTPVVTGAVALVWAQVPSWTYKQIRAHVLSNVRKSPAWTGLTTTGGILDIHKMLANLPSRPTINVSIADVSVDESASHARVVVTTTAPPDRDVSVGLFTQNVGSAVPGQDFYGTYQQVVIKAGQDTAAARIAILDDSIVEGDETFVVRLGAPDGVRIGDGSATVTIRDDDDNSGPAVLSVADVQLAEGGANNVLTVELSRPLGTDVSVTIFTSPTGDAVPGSDYYGFTRVLTIAAGETAASTRVTILDDTVAEANETLSYRIVDPLGNAQLGDRRGTITITDDD